MSLREALCRAFFLCALALVGYIEFRRSHADEHDDVTRLRQTLSILMLAVVCWPVLLVQLGVDLLSPVTSVAAAVALLHLQSDATVYTSYTGPIAEYGSVAISERSGQVCSISFAVATLLFAGGNRKLQKEVMLPIFTALLLATCASASVQRQRDSSPRWDALRRTSISYAAGLMGVALATCIDKVLTQAHPFLDGA